MNNSGDCRWFQHLLVKLGFLTTSKNCKRMDFIEGVVNIEMKNGQRLRFTHEDVDSMEKFLNESLKCDILNKEGCKMNDNYKCVKCGIVKAVIGLHSGGVCIDCYTTKRHKWYSHLEEKISRLAYSGKVKKVMYSPSSVNIVTDVDTHLVYMESDCVALEKFLNDMLAHVTDRIPTPNCRCVGTPVTDRTDEIIEMLRDTKKDEKICGFAAYDDVIEVFQKSDSSGELFKHYEYDKIVAYLESLYNEEFTIEREEDISRIKKGATVTLSNGNSMNCTNRNTCSFTDDEGWSIHMTFTVLKGSKVVQSC